MMRVIELCGPDFLVTSGDDSLTLPLLAVGGEGVVSVAANIIPGKLREFWDTWEKGELLEARESFYKLLPFFRTLFLETNPIPIKHALYLAGRMDKETRLPLTEPSPETSQKLKELLKAWGII
jgi:4-hydroxy-tetrahydrodipicolinate synthase